MNLQPFEMPGDPVVAGIVTCVFWQVLALAVYGMIQAWLAHHIAKTPAGRVGVAVVGLLLAVPLAILQTCIAIPLLHMYQDGPQTFFLVGILILDGALAFAISSRSSGSSAPPAPTPQANTTPTAQQSRPYSNRTLFNRHSQPGGTP